MSQYYSRKILNLRSTVVWAVAIISFLSLQVINASTRNAGTAAEFVSALSNSTSNDIINLTNNIVITSEQIINKSITINGNDYSISVPNPGLDDMGRFNTGASTFRVFTISSGYTVIMNNLTIKGGSTTNYGGAVYIISTGVLRLNNCIISNSRNTFSGGGGIANYGVVYLNNSLVYRNASMYRGGFFNRGTMYVENSTLSENRSTSSGGGGGAGENRVTYISTTLHFQTIKVQKLEVA